MVYLQRHALTSPAAAVHAWLPHDRQGQGHSDLDCRLEDRVGVVGGCRIGHLLNVFNVHSSSLASPRLARVFEV